MRLLYVEDDSRMVAFVAKGLKEAGYVVVHAADGVSGLQLALTESFMPRSSISCCRGWTAWR